MAIGITAVFELFHILTALEFSRDALGGHETSRAPAAGDLASGRLLAANQPRAPHTRCASGTRTRWPALGIGLTIVGHVGMLSYLRLHPPYTAPTWFGITRPSLVLVPFLALAVGISYWRVRGTERLGRIIALFSILSVVSNVAMLYAQAPADAPAMLAHAARFANGLFLLFTLSQMGTIDTARRMRAELDLTRLNEALEDRVRARTADLETGIPLCAPRRPRANLPSQDTRATQPLASPASDDARHRRRQDLASIFQVVVGNLEDHLNVDFACLCHYDQVERKLTVACVGANSTKLAAELELASRRKSRSTRTAWATAFAARRCTNPNRRRAVPIRATPRAQRPAFIRRGAAARRTAQWRLRSPARGAQAGRRVQQQ